MGELFWRAYLAAVRENAFIRLVLACVAADTVFGCLRAVRYRKWNSAVGIDGGIRKAGMIFSALFLAMVDEMLHINVIGWVGNDTAAVLTRLGVGNLGIAEFFCLLYILYEATSILKNMLMCGLPIPAGIKEKAARWLQEMTEESPEKGMSLCEVGKADEKNG